MRALGEKGSHVIQTTGIKAETTKRVSGKNGFLSNTGFNITFLVMKLRRNHKFFHHSNQFYSYLFNQIHKNLRDREPQFQNIQQIKGKTTD